MSAHFQRVSFAGTPAFAATILERLLAAGVAVAAVLTQPDRPAGRGRKLTASAVKQVALAHDLPLLQPASLKSADALQALAEHAPDVMVVAAYGLILPPAVLALPAAGCLNVHASLLPRWRGAAPVERAILAGDSETGVCIMQMDAGLDTGPVRLTRRRAIGPLETGGELEAALAELGAGALLDVLTDPEAYPPRPQPAEGVTYAAKLSRADAEVDFAAPAAAVARRILAMNPARPVAVRCAGVGLQLLRAQAVAAAASPARPGDVVHAGPSGLQIACGDGVLALLEARVLRGKASVMDAATLIRTQADLLHEGARLEPA